MKVVGQQLQIENATFQRPLLRGYELIDDFTEHVLPQGSIRLFALTQNSNARRSDPPATRGST